MSIINFYAEFFKASRYDHFHNREWFTPYEWRPQDFVHLSALLKRRPDITPEYFIKIVNFYWDNADRIEKWSYSLGGVSRHFEKLETFFLRNQL